MPAELEQTLALMTSHRSVLGYLLITRGAHPRMIRHSGIVFDGEQGKKYAAVVARIVETVQAGLEEIQGDDAVGETDDADLVRDFIVHWRSILVLISRVVRMRYDSCGYARENMRL
jgi:dynein light chain roadblock-type